MFIKAFEMWLLACGSNKEKQLCTLKECFPKYSAVKAAEIRSALINLKNDIFPPSFNKNCLHDKLTSLTIV